MKKRLLCITPDFKRSGAPLALLGLLRILLKRDAFVINVMAYGEGELYPLYKNLLGTDHVEILHGLTPTPEFRQRLLNDPDIVLLNTVATLTFLFYYQNTDIPVYWWIHESPELIKDSFPAFPNPHLLSPNFHLFVPSLGTADLFYAHYSYKADALPAPVFVPEYPMPDIPFKLPDDRVIFLIPSAYSYIKGQDLLLSAIRSLPDKYKDQSFFIFCGYTLDKQIEFKKTVYAAASDMDNVLMLEDQPQEIVYSLMDKCHCIVAPSRIDCLPTTIAEGFMFGKICLVSSQTGISSYIKDCVNGFIFKDNEELIKRLLLIINDFESLNKVAYMGHKVYLDVFSPEAIENSLAFKEN